MTKEFDQPVCDNQRALQELRSVIDDLSVVNPEYAPNVHLAVGRVGTHTSAGCALSKTEAMKKCVGEAAEILAQSRPLPDFLLSETGKQNCPAELLRYVDEKEPAFLNAVNLATGEKASIPASLASYCHESPVPIVRSSGCAAGMDTESATLSAASEIIEHAIVSAWWRSGTKRRVHGLPALVEQKIEGFTTHIRGEADSRVTYTAHLGSRYGFDVCIAWSFFREKGDGFMIASAADQNMFSAARSAVYELIQLEWGLARALETMKKRPQDLDDWQNHVLRFAQATTISNFVFLPSENPDQRNGRKRRATSMQSEVERQSNGAISAAELVERMNDEGVTCLAALLHSEPGLDVIKLCTNTFICNFPPLL